MVKSKIMRQMCYKMAQNHMSLIHFSIIFSDMGHNVPIISKVSEPATQVKWLLTWISHHSRINSLNVIFLSCLIIFDLTHKDPFTFKKHFGPFQSLHLLFSQHTAHKKGILHKKYPSVGKTLRFLLNCCHSKCIKIPSMLPVLKFHHFCCLY